MRLIDADAFKSFLCKCCNILRSEEPCEPSDCNVLAVIDEQPTVDAVGVVRCKDCKHYKPQNQGAHRNCTTPYCQRVVSIKVSPDDFCSYGERRSYE